MTDKMRNAALEATHTLYLIRVENAAGLTEYVEGYADRLTDEVSRIGSADLSSLAKEVRRAVYARENRNVRYLARTLARSIQSRIA